MKNLMRLLILSVTVTFVVSVIDYIGEFERFMIKYNKEYQCDAEEAYRLGIFSKELKQVLDHNEQYNRGDVPYDIGINQFSDLLFEELHFGYVPFGHLPPPPYTPPALCD